MILTGFKNAKMLLQMTTKYLNVTKFTKYNLNNKTRVHSIHCKKSNCLKI